jgi:PKD repeat protein
MFKKLIFPALVFMLLSVIVSAQPPKCIPIEKSKYPVLAQQFKESIVFQFDTKEILDQRNNDQQGFFTNFSIGETYNWTLALEPNKIKADNYKLSIATDYGKIDGITDKGIYTFGGIVHQTEHDVRLTIMENFLYGYIEIDGDAVFIEPLDYYVDGVAEDLFIAYKASDVIQNENLRCGVTEMRKRGRMIKNHHHVEKSASDSRMPGNCYELDMAYANDFLMFQQFGSVAAVEAHVTGVLNNVQGNYDDEFSDEIQFLIVEIFVPTSAAQDPFISSTNPNLLLDDFTDWGPTGFSVTHDLGALWSDRNFNGGTIGLAWLNAVCTSIRYHIMENFSSNAQLLRVLHAHEMGHNFSFTHDPSGSNTIMAPSVNSATAWSTQSQNQFDNYIPNIDPPNGCLVFCPPPVPPVAIFTPNYSPICQGSYVTLFDQSLNSPNSWSWSMPGATPSSSTEQNPTVQYNNTGNFNVTLTVSNANGSNTVSGTVIVVPNGGTDIFFYEGFESGIGQFSLENPDGGKTWTNTSVVGTQEGIKAMYVNNYDYNAVGEEDALISPVLDFSGRTNTSLELEYAYKRYNNTYKDSLKVYISTNGGSSYTTVFANTENGSGNFATGPQSTSEFIPEQDTDWCYATTYGPGCLSVDLSAYDGLPNIVVKIVNKNGYGNNMYVDNVRLKSSCVVQNPPVALFSGTPTDGCSPFVVSFTDQSTNSPSSWSWSFPGGTPASSSQQNPFVTYDTPGTYSVTLTATNAAGSDTETITGMINVEGVPVASFNHVNNNGTVDFTNTSTGSNLTYQWAFGDGNGSSASNPSHTYSDDGVYTVVLVVTGPCGVDVFEQTIFVESLPVGGFSALETEVCEGETVSFVDESSTNVINWAWSFPGGTPSTSAQENPQVVYNTPGVYDVTLIVASTVGNDTVTLEDYIEVDPLPEAGFTNVVSGNDVAFTNTSGDADSFQWSFGDGGTSTEQDPNYSYSTDGIYTVQLIATNSCGSDTLTEEITISSLPLAGISSDVNIGCVPLTVNFLDISSGNTTSWLWTFENGTPATSTEQNPSVTYNTTGAFDVTLIATNANGSDTLSLEDYVLVNDIPTSNFTYTISDQEVILVNTSIDADSYLWDFGDGNTDTATDLTYDYGADGIYTLTLIATNNCGSDTLSEIIEIATLPEAAFTSDNQGGCLPVEIQYTDSSSPNTSSWSWTFEGGTPSSSTDQNPLIEYNATGVFDVQLIVSNGVGSDTLVFEDYVVIEDVPNTDFSYIIEDQSIILSNLTSGADSYLWDLGDGTTDTSTELTYDYGADGIYTLTLIATNACGSDTLSEVVEIATLPEAGFTSDNQGGCLPVEIQYTDNSSPNTSTWSWTFEGGTPSSSSDQNPLIEYNEAGVFDVQLIVSNGVGSDTLVFEDYVVIEDVPNTDFSYLIEDQSIILTNLTTGADSYFWDLGDGTTDTATEFTYDYGADGIYTLTLIATNACGSDTLSEVVEIATLPEAGFTSDNQGGCLPVEIQYTDNSSPNTSTWSWTFEGGTPSSSSEQNPLIAYNEAGVFDVQLVVSNGVGSDTLVFEDYVEILGLPTASFSAIEDNLDVSFVNTSMDADSYFWDFGDSNTSTESDPMHLYNEVGSYTVTLVATNACGSDTSSVVLDVNFGPQAIIDSDISIGCPELTVQFNDGFAADVDTWEWNFEGGNPSTASTQNPIVTYDQSGNFDVQLIVSNVDGSDTLLLEDYITVLELPVADFSSSIVNADVSFVNESLNSDSYTWDFGDGTISNDENPDHIYGDDGVYSVLLIASGICGVDSITQEVLIVTPPTADFILVSDSICEGGLVQFSNSSSLNTTSWEWNFEGGNPSLSSEPNPIIEYNQPGQYDVTLIVSNAAGSDTLTMLNAVTVNPNPEAQFSTSLNEGVVSLTNTSQNADVYTWFFGDGDISNEFEPVHTYLEEGVFEILLIVSNSCGTDSVSQILDVVLPPSANFEASATEGCTPFEVQFTNLSSANSDSFQWEFEGATPSVSTEENPLVIYENEGLFDVQLIVTNSIGSDTLFFENMIDVGPGIQIDFTSNVIGDSVLFTNTSINATDFLWDFGDDQTSTEENPTHNYEMDGVYTVVLTASNDCETVSLEQEVIISVGPPIALFDINQVSSCAGTEVEFLNLSSSTAESYLWSFPGGVPSTSTEENPTVIYPDAGVYSASLTASNVNGSGSFELIGEIIVYDAPVADFDYSVSGFSVSFTNNSENGVSYLWDFGDGSGQSNIGSPSYLYSEVGEYNVSLTVMNPCDTIVTETLVVIDASPPSAFFEGTPNQGCTPLEVLFTDLSSGSVTNWYWQFEGGIPSTSTDMNPVVVYESPGEYDVTLTVSNAVSSDVIQFSNYIEVGKGPEAFFIYQNGVLGGIQFTNASTDATNYSWDFGDGTTSGVISPLHFYDEAGSYDVQLIAYNECGSDTMVATVDYVPVSVNELNELTSLDIYPNPTSGSFEFNLTLADKAERELEVSVLDLLGRELKKRAFSVTNGRLSSGFDISDLPSGLYYLEFESGTRKTVERIIKL